MTNVIARRARRQIPGLESLEGRVVLSPTSPLGFPAVAVDPPATVIDNPDEMMERLAEEATREASNSLLQQMWERDRSIPAEAIVIPDFPPPGSMTPEAEATWYDAVWEAVRQGLETGFGGSPQIHP